MIPALIVGGYTAWFLGLRTGAVAAVSVAIGLLLAGLLPIPGLTLVVYALVLGWCAALFFFGRQMSQSTGAGRRDMLSGLGALAARARQLMRR